MKLKNINVDIEKVFVSKKIYSGGKNYKYFVSYLYDDYKIKLSHIMLLKMKVCKQLWWSNKVDSVFIWRWWLMEKSDTVWDKKEKNLRTNLSTIKNFWKSK